MNTTNSDGGANRRTNTNTTTNNHNRYNSIIRNNTTPAVEIMIGISCSVFDSYQNIPLTLSPSFIDEVFDMETAESGMKHLSRHVCTHVICTIYEDLLQKNDHAKIRQLLQRAQSFHIHGRTARDIIFPSYYDDPHAHHGRYVYVCTHC